METLRTVQRGSLPKGSQKKYFPRLWHRLQEEATSEDEAEIGVSIPTVKESRLKHQQRVSDRFPTAASLPARSTSTAASEKANNFNCPKKSDLPPSGDYDMSSFVSLSASRSEEEGNCGGNSLSELSKSSRRSMKSGNQIMHFRGRSGGGRCPIWQWKCCSDA